MVLTPVVFSMNYALLLLFCLLVVAVAPRVLKCGRVSALPPGPKGLPIVGSLFQAPTKLLFLKLGKWAEVYGPIFSYTLLGQPVIVLSTAKVAGDILDRLSSKTSDRPRLIKFNEYLCRNNHFSALPANATWRMHRRAAHETLNVNAVKAMQPMQEEEALFLTEGLLKHPELTIVDHLHRHSSSLAWRLVYGHASIPLEGPNPAAPLDDLIKELFLSAVPGASIVDLVPFLNPLIARSKLLRRQSDRVYNNLSAFFTKAFSDKQVEGQPSLSSKLKETGSKLGLSAHDCAWVGGNVFEAAQDTTATAMGWFVLAMLKFPDAAAAARSELQAKIGDRAPCLSDRSSLPQIEAIVKEVLRWRPPAPAGVPHLAAEDLTYDSYRIPKGAIIIPDVWSMCRDHLLYPNGDTFDPSRFIDAEGRLKRAQKDTHDDYLPFGHGRRVCVGKNFAINSMWIAVAYLLWAFDFQKARDTQGNEITPDAMDFIDNGATVWPNSFPVVPVPRFPDLSDRLRVRKLEMKSSM